jgi:hypothetical protein
MKWTLVGAVAVFGLVVGVAMFGTSVTSHAQGASTTKGVSPIERGFEIAPVPLNLDGLNPSLVGFGSYIVNAHGGCNDCHTAPPYADGGDPFLGQPELINAAGYLAGGTQFGPFTSRNLTPRAPNRLPANLTLPQFIEVMRHGTDLKNGHPQISPLLQVMPWPVYGKMSDKDLVAIYEFLRAIPCIGSAARCGG